MDYTEQTVYKVKQNIHNIEKQDNITIRLGYNYYSDSSVKKARVEVKKILQDKGFKVSYDKNNLYIIKGVKK